VRVVGDEHDAILRLRGYDPPSEGIVVFRFEPRGDAGAG